MVSTGNNLTLFYRALDANISAMENTENNTFHSVQDMNAKKKYGNNTYIKEEYYGCQVVGDGI